MNTPVRCPVCASEVPEAAPEGMCPRCLITLAGGAGGATRSTVEATFPNEAPVSQRVSGTGMPFVLPSVSLKAGTRIGEYELLREIGRGGMGVVYEGRHIGLKRRVAIKMLPWAEFASSEQCERFRREAEAVARLHHPHIVAVFEWGSHEGCPFMAMQLVEDARSLAEEIANNPMPPREAARVLAKVARAVHYSHQHGVLHRDIKPGNILLDGKGEPLLVDFGLARLEDAAFQLTHSDLVFGTPSYMPPEQAAGEDITTAADVYSLGAVLYEALTGKPPFRGKTVAETMRLVTEQEPAAPRACRPEVARDLNTIVLKCLEKKPARRYGSSEALADDLERWLDDWPIRARPGTVTTRAVKWARRRPAVAGLAVALVCTVLIGLALLIAGWHEARARLWDTLLAKARAQRLSHESGQRVSAIQSLQQAAKIRPSIELQNEAVAALALSDLTTGEVWNGNPERQALVALSRDFVLNAFTRADGTIVVCEGNGGNVMATLPGSGTPVNWILRFSPDGRWLAAGYCHSVEDQEQVEVVVWDWKISRRALQLTGVSRASLDFSPDGTRLVVCRCDELHFYRLPDGKEEGPFKWLPAPCHTVRVSPDGKYVAASFATSTGVPGGMAILTTDNLRAEPAWLGKENTVKTLSWHPRLHWIAAPCGDGSIRVWDVAKGRLLQTINGHTNQVLEAVWNPAGDLIASTSSDGTLKLWDAATSELFVSLDESASQILFSPDGTRLGPGLDRTRVRLFAVAPLMACRRLRSVPDGPVLSAAWSREPGFEHPGDTLPHGGLLATAGKQVRLWNTAGYELATLDFADPRSVLFTKRSLIVTGGGGVARWPVRVERQDRAFRAVLGPAESLIRAHDWQFAALSADEKSLAVASPEEVALFDLSVAGKPPQFLRGHIGASSVAVSPNGEFIATGTRKGNEVWVWKSATCQQIERLPVRGGACVAFTADGKNLITGNAEEYLSWDTKTWKPGVSHPRHDDMPGAIAVSPRETAMGIAYTRNKARIVVAATLRTVLEPECGSHSPLCFSADGSLFVSANPQGNVFVWDMAWIRHEVARLGLDFGEFRPLDSSHAPLIEMVTMTDAVQN